MLKRYFEIKDCITQISDSEPEIQDLLLRAQNRLVPNLFSDMEKLNPVKIA